MSYIILHRLALSCSVLHHLALPSILLHHLAASCILLHYLASTCIVLHHLASSSIILRTETRINTTNVNSFFVWKLPHKWPKKAQYQDAMNDTCYFIFVWKLPQIWPKKISTVRLQITCVTILHYWYACIRLHTKKNVQYHNAVNGTHCLIFFWKESTETIKTGSVPWCLARHTWFHFCVENHT